MANTSISFTIRGLNSMEDKLRKLILNSKADMLRSFTLELEKALTLTKRKYVPVDKGPLRSGGRVVSVKRVGNELQGVIAFSGPQALAIHEHPSSSSPPSWRGADVVFSPAGTGEKYISRGLNESSEGMPERIMLMLLRG